MKIKTNNSHSHTLSVLKNRIELPNQISVLAILAIIVFFTNLNLFLYNRNLTPFPPSYYIYLFSALVLLLVINSKTDISVLRSPLILWTFGFILTSFIWYLFSYGPEIQYQTMTQRILAVMFIIIMLLTFSTEKSQLWAKRTFLLAVFIAVILNIYEAYFPVMWSNVLGRSAGLYVNPNQSGIACVIGMILSITVIKEKYRLIFALFVGIGVMYTFSQGALLVWFISVVLMLFFRTIPFKNNFYTVCLLAVLAVLIGIALNNFGTPLLEDDTSQKQLMWERIQVNTISSQSSREDRAALAENAWAMFSEKPLLGNGIGSSIQIQGVHNMYLSYLAEQGVIGFFIFPIFAISIIWGAAGTIRKEAITFLISILLWGFFSHNILDERYILISCSYLSACIMFNRLKRPQQFRWVKG